MRLRGVPFTCLKAQHRNTQLFLRATIFHNMGSKQSLAFLILLLFFSYPCLNRHENHTLLSGKIRCPVTRVIVVDTLQYEVLRSIKTEKIPSGESASKANPIKTVQSHSHSNLNETLQQMTLLLLKYIL